MSTYSDAVSLVQAQDWPYEAEIECLEVLEALKGEFEPEQCSACNGTGESSFSGSTCKTCHGSGEIKKKEYQNDCGNIDPIFKKFIQPFSPNKEAA